MLAVKVHLLHPVIFPARGEGVEGDLERFFFRVARGVATEPETDLFNGITHRPVIKDEDGPKLLVAVRIGVNPGQGVRVYFDINCGYHSINVQLPVVRERGLRPGDRGSA